MRPKQTNAVFKAVERGQTVEEITKRLYYKNTISPGTYEPKPAATLKKLYWALDYKNYHKQTNEKVELP